MKTVTPAFVQVWMTLYLFSFKCAHAGGLRRKLDESILQNVMDPFLSTIRNETHNLILNQTESIRTIINNDSPHLESLTLIKNETQNMIDSPSQGENMIQKYCWEHFTCYH